MKTKIYLSTIMLTLGLFVTTNAQVSQPSSWNTKSEVYLIYADFRAKKLTLEADYTKEKHKIRFHVFFERPYIEVIHEGKKYIFQKNGIYGIRDVEGKDYRFFNDKEYLIADTSALYVYKTFSYESTGGKNPQSKMVTNYYFSKSGGDKIQPLTLFDIKNTYPANHTHHDLIDTQFKSYPDLYAYDDFHKMFKINRFLLSNLK